MADYKVTGKYEGREVDEGLKKTQKNLKDLAVDAEKAASRYGKGVSEMVASTRKFKGQMADIGKGFNTFTNTVASGGASVSSLATNFLQFGSKASVSLGAITALGTAFADNVSRSRDFEESISHLSALTGMVGSDLDYLKKAAIELGSSTTQSSSEVAQAFMIVGSKSPELLKSGKALKEVTANAITLAEAGLMSVEDAANALTGVLNQFNIPATKSQKDQELLIP